MFQRELSETLIELIESVSPPTDSGLIITEAEIDLPLEANSVVQKNELVFLGNVPHSRWKSGFLPPITMSHIRVVLVEDL
jgi:hypothetical protein